MRNYIFPLVMLFFSSCNKDIQDITVEGIVRYAENKEPISGIEVTIVCWKYKNSPDESYSENETKIVRTDSEGKYKIHFDDGAFVEVQVDLRGYIKGHESQEIYDKKNTINILMNKK